MSQTKHIFYCEYISHNHRRAQEKTLEYVHKWKMINYADLNICFTARVNIWFIQCLKHNTYISFQPPPLPEFVQWSRSNKQRDDSTGSFKGHEQRFWI